jgi:hypothetical protein
MADKKRSESLQEQLDRLLAQSPKPYTSAQEEEIKRGRKKQADIDAGRATIEKRNEEVRKAQEQIDKLNEQIGKAIEFEAGEARLAKQGARQDEQDRAKASDRAFKESWTGIGMDTASKVPAALTGYAVGRGVMGGGINYASDTAQKFKNKVLEGIAGDRVKGLTTSAGARTGAERAGVMPSANSVLRVGGRMLPHTVGGLGMAAKGIAVLSADDSEDPAFTQSINRGAGYGMLGAGLGILEKGAQYGVAPGVSADGQAIAAIDSNQLRRGGLNQAAQPQTVDKGALTALPAPDDDTPAPKGPNPGTRDHLAEQAKSLGVKVTTRMGKQEIADAMSAKLKELGTKRVRAPKLPKGTGVAGVAGGLAYAMTPDQAEAADGSQGGNQTQALTNAGIAGGTAYGVSKGLSALGPVAKGVMAGTSEGMAPAAIDSLTDWHGQPEELQKFDQFATGNLPDFMTGGSRERLSMAQVPPRNPMRPTAGMFEPQGADAEFEAALQAFLQEYEAGSAGDSMAAEAY